MARKTTIEDVAHLAGVSLSTADRVLNARGGVTPDKERRVMNAARTLGIDRILSRGYTRSLRVAVLIQAPVNPFHAALRDAFVSGGRLYADLNIHFLVHHIDPNQPGRTAAIIRETALRHDGLIVTSPADPLVVSALHEVAESLPVLTLATDIPGSGRRAYVGPDDRQAGRVAGDLMGRFLGPAGGEVLMIAGLLTIAGHRDREAGFRAVLSEHYQPCRLSAILESREDPDRAGRLVLSALRDNPALRGIYHASAGAGAVVEAVRHRRRADLVIITHELTDDRRRLLRERAIHVVVDQNPVAEVRAAIETMAKLLGRLDGAPVSTVTAVQIYTAENV